MNKNSDVRLFCFSPLVMITTFIIELCSAFYVLFRYHADTKARLIISLLGFLALFQLAEYMVCEKAFLLNSLDWARVGYVSITLLPPLGLHLGMSISKKYSGMLLKTAYGSAAVFITFFLFVGNGLKGEQCLGNYIIFSTASYAVFPYAAYYFGWLITTIHFLWKAHYHIKNISHRQALVWLVVGYLAFMVPTIIINIINPETIIGIPSIMCGFAILFAFCLLFKIAPLVLREKASFDR